jgi:hypothetical protein
MFRSLSSLNILFTSGLGAQDPFGLAVNVGLVLDGNAAEVAEDVLHLGVGVAASSTAKVVNPFHADQDIINQRNDNGNTDGVAPDDDDRNDGSLGAVVVAGEGIDGINKSELIILATGEPACNMC